MTLNDLLTLPGARFVQSDGAPVEILDAYTSDMLSDVMANAPDGSVLITIQAHANTIAVATLAGIRAILVCRDRPVPPDMLEAAKREHVAIAVTSAAQYEASWRVHDLLAAPAP
jgi:hypothetical protein